MPPGLLRPSYKKALNKANRISQHDIEQLSWKMMNPSGPGLKPLQMFIGADPLLPPLPGSSVLAITLLG